MSRAPKSSLIESDIKLFSSLAGIEKEIIVDWFADLKKETYDLCLDRRVFKKYYLQLFPEYDKIEELMENMYKAYDRDGSGISTGLFLFSIVATSKTNLQERLTWIFNFYDLDANGFIEIDEFKKILIDIYKLCDLYGKGGISPETKAIKIFSVLDANSDKRISRTEFVRGCFDDPFLKNLFNPNL